MSFTLDKIKRNRMNAIANRFIEEIKEHGADMFYKKEISENSLFFIRKIELRENFRKVDFQKQKNDLEKSIIGNELLVLIGLIDLARLFGSSYTIPASKISWKSGLRIPEVITHIQSLRNKGVIVVRKQSNNHDQKQQDEFYHIELAATSAIHEPLLVRFYQSIKRRKQYVR